MAIVIELLSFNRRVRHRHYFQHGEIGIGRGYDNEVVLDDIHADAYHATLRVTTDKQMLLVDNHSVNGIRDKKHRLLGSHIALKSGDEFFLGKTRIRVVDTEYPMPDAVTLNADSWVRKVANSTLVGFVLLCLLLLVDGYDSYIATTEELKYKDVFKALVMYAGVVVGLATFLSFVGKVIRREWRFGFHLFLICFLMSLASIQQWIIHLLAFNFSIASYAWLVDAFFIGLWVYLFMMGISQSVFLIKPLHMRAMTIAIAGILVLLSVSDKLFVNPDKFVSIPVYTKLFRPEPYRLREPMSEADFMQKAQAVFDIDVDK